MSFPPQSDIPSLPALPYASADSQVSLSYAASAPGIRGGGDYITKPFSLEELVARVRTVIRRIQPAENTSGKLKFSDLEMNEDSHEVWRAERQIDLTPTEFALLRFLLLNSGRVVSKSQIL